MLEEVVYLYLFDVGLNMSEENYDTRRQMAKAAMIGHVEDFQRVRDEKLVSRARAYVWK